MGTIFTEITGAQVPTGGEEDGAVPSHTERALRGCSCAKGTSPGMVPAGSGTEVGGVSLR